ncbi:hypothetical protein JAAARDRAFT_197229 [Jaapia argillacea MUCL 33604]|uniref:alkaline phosphatase n=1 Tax=Jaapia argillacea MUCL 33604 TaxID=933084 RepID=A0A067PIW7_9AGAM|nr:hypothetical protein JAAARDRAFT_197229 [Jaapia argillacea MUCL 33604]
MMLLINPGLKEMTLKAIDILTERNKEKGWFIMSEAASTNKQMHTLDYDRALVDELLELDDTIRASIEHLKACGSLDDTLIVVCDPSIPNASLLNQLTARNATRSVPTNQTSGLSQCTSSIASVMCGEGARFPARWDPRYTYMAGIGAHPDARENYSVHKDGPREPDVAGGSPTDFVVNYKDAVTGFIMNGTLRVNNDQGFIGRRTFQCSQCALVRSC